MAACLAATLTLAATGCRKQTLDTAAPESARAIGGTMSGDPTLLQQDDGQWVMPARNYASTRFSGLDEINAQTVRRLGVAWTFPNWRPSWPRWRPRRPATRRPAPRG